MTQQVTIDGFEGLQQVFDGLEKQFRDADYSKSLAAFIPELRSLHAHHFHSSTAPNGQPWQPLAESTVLKKGHSTILVDTQRLRKSLTTSGHGDQIARVTHRGAIFGTSVPYTVYHQQGTSRMPARPPVGMTEESVESLAEQIADATVEHLK